MKHVFLAVAVLLAVAAPTPSRACNPDTGEREQLVFLSSNGKPLTHWVAASGEMKRITLPNGFALGITLDEPEPRAERRRPAAPGFGPEMVKISLYDLGAGEPRALTYTYGGTNSLQGYGAQGGADRVEELGSPGILLTLLKPVCVRE